ncbi:MAG: class I SAM-dependent methyltransferase [Patescibacteria group bacterium]
MKKADDDYDAYWRSRDIEAGLNSFQIKRVILLRREIDKNDSILDVGCGDGRFLDYLKEKSHQGELLGVDSSDYVLEKAKNRGLVVIKKDIRDVKQLSDLGPPVGGFDVVVLFEVLEHMANAEELLEWAYGHSKKAVIFSVPNTGFVVHRLRLLFGRFPLQWRVHPSEHLRFWTLGDMKWWLKSQSYKNFKIRLYEGVPILNRLWPSLFGQGILVVLRK